MTNFVISYKCMLVIFDICNEIESKKYHKIGTVPNSNWKMVETVNIYPLSIFIYLYIYIFIYLYIYVFDIYVFIITVCYLWWTCLYWSFFYFPWRGRGCIYYLCLFDCLAIKYRAYKDCHRNAFFLYWLKTKRSM